jgi:WD40 repeat protein
MAFENLRNKAEVLINTLRQESTAWVVVQELKHATRDKKMDKKTNKELPDPVWVMKYSYDGRFFASGGQDGVVKVWCLSDDPIQERVPFFFGFYIR